MKVFKSNLKKLLREEIYHFGLNLTEKQKQIIVEGIFSKLASAFGGTPSSSTPIGSTEKKSVSPYREAPTVDRTTQINAQKQEDETKRIKYFSSEQFNKFDDLMRDLDFDLLRNMGFSLTKRQIDNARKKIVLGLSAQYRPIFDSTLSYRDVEERKRAFKAVKDLYLWIIDQQKSINPIDIDNKDIESMKEYFKNADEEISKNKINMRTSSQFPD